MFMQRLKLATSKLAHSWGLPRPIIKSHTEEKVDVALCYRFSPKFWGLPLIFVQRLKLATYIWHAAVVGQGPPYM